METNNTIAIVLGNAIRLVQPETIDATHRYFSDAVAVETLIFYDWLEDPQGRVNGITIHVEETTPFAAKLTSRPYVTFDPFLTIWFTNQQSGVARGLEAFGDIELLGLENDEHAVLVSTAWLHDGELTSLQAAIRPPTNR